MILWLAGCLLLESSKISFPMDVDQDGYTLTDGDCDDDNADVYPTAPELCDGLDNNCDNLIDEQDPMVQDALQGYVDADQDGFGAGDLQTWCELPESYSDSDTDCDDNDARVYPTATEICDGLDNNCDNLMDEQDPMVQDALQGYVDGDQDGFGAGNLQTWCELPEFYSDSNTDCDDGDADVHPMAYEFCDGMDNDCNGLMDDEEGYYLPDMKEGFLDTDQDGYGAIGVAAGAWCTLPTGYVRDNSDCNDSDASIYPGAIDVFDDLIDADCDHVDTNVCALSQISTCTEKVMMPSGNGIDFTYISAGDVFTNATNSFSISRDFVIMTTEFTQGFYSALGLPSNPTFPDPQHPIESITWHQAAFTANQLTTWVNSHYGLALDMCYNCTGGGSNRICVSAFSDVQSCSGYRLPTSAEWEYVARSGAMDEFSTTDGEPNGEHSLYPTECTSRGAVLSGNSNHVLTDFAWYCANSQVYTSVASRQPNTWGVYDMYGNVAEWVYDSFKGVPSGVDPIFYNNNNQHVIRGGSFYSSPETMGNTYQEIVPNSNNTQVQRVDVGMRLVRTVVFP